jgi:cell shape-determining protein MreD
MGPITQALQSVQTQLMTLAVPLGIIGLVCAVLAFLITPLLGEALGNHRGFIQRALLAIAFVGFIPGIVAGLYALGGGGG